MRTMYLLVAVLVLATALCEMAVAQQSQSQQAERQQLRVTGDALVPMSFLETRVDRFSDLRTKRSELSKRLTTLEAELKDLRQKTIVLQESLKQASSERVVSFSSRTASSQLDGLTEDKKRLEFDYQQKVKDLEAAKEKYKAELDKVKQQVAAGTGDPTSVDELTERVARYEEEFERQKAQFEFDKGLLDEKIKKAEEERAAIQADREKYAATQAALASDLQKQIADNETLIDEKAADLAELYVSIDSVDAEIMKLIDVGDADGWFKILISLTFAVLVGGVIVGFFLAIRGDKATVNAIFSNDSGIQFVTIFSIIIAVILFGIIGVLEGKELSALLGGLSGYILGRSSASPKSPRSDSGTTPAADSQSAQPTGLQGSAAATSGNQGPAPAGAPAAGGGGQAAPVAL